MKYVIPFHLVSPIREFVRIFASPDPYGDPETGEYEVSTLFFDTYRRDCFRHNEEKSVNRFKLRARCYGSSEESPLFFEIKRRFGDVIDKSRAAFPPGWGDIRELLLGSCFPAELPARHRPAFADFERLLRLVDARPVMRVRYTRESYTGDSDVYARVTFDRALRYQRASDWALPGKGRWRTMDVTGAMAREYPGVVLELKCTADQPKWIAELIERFDLVRCDFCKYATATRLELVEQGYEYSATLENCSF